MKYTGNYNLKKPEGTDTVNIEDFNDNADIIDAELKKNADEIAAHKAENASQHGDLTTLKTSQKSSLVEAINELFTNVSNGKQLVGGAITDVDKNVIIPADPTFSDLASAIGQISTGKKWAKGRINSPSGTISGLDFEPKYIFLNMYGEPYSNSITYGAYYCDVELGINRGVRATTNISHKDTYDNKVNIRTDGFSFTAFSYTTYVDWFAIE